ncbi:MAG: dehydrogenase [Cyanobacteria bacterium RYN_339]|nr:dehydrogenase [Cyanobacteria bacterium RYN_339]
MSTTATQALSVPAAIEARHSIRKYKDQPVPAADLREILRLTSLAPSSANIQPWRFVVVENKALQAQLQAAAFNQAQVGSAPALIVVYADHEDVVATADEVIHPGVPPEGRERSRGMIAGFFAGKTLEQAHAITASQSGIAVGFLVLAAQSLGYSTSVMLGFDPAKVRELLDLPAHVNLPALIALGVADEPGFGTHRHPVDRLARFVS